MLLERDEKNRKAACASCGVTQTFARPEVELDKETAEMLRTGVLRKCPACSAYQVKEKGICNVIQVSPVILLSNLLW